MKTIAEPTFVQTSNVGETKRATIKASAKIFNFFSEQIYSDKFTAIWRELVANGIDGQKVNGSTERPIVTVPSILEPYAKVRDFGCSMDHEFMMDKFMAFTDASTKETSNEFIGGFGIGSKAPLSYTDQYSIRCFKDGTVRVYSVFKDEEGCPSIAFLSETETDEPDGVEVGFPVRQDDISKFTATVVQTLQYFDPLPRLDNTELELNPVQYDARGAKWGVRLSTPGVHRRSNIVIGGVAYPLDYGKIPYQYRELRNYGNIGLDLYLNIGEANIALSREHVTHDDALFQKLEALVKDIGPEFGKQISKKFDTAATPWEAKKILSDAIEGADYTMANLLRKFAVYKGQKIEMQITRPKDFEVLAIAYGHFNYNERPSSMIVTEAVSPKFRAWPEYGGFTPATFNRIIIDDVAVSDKPSNRIRAVIEKHPKERILFLRWNDPAKPADWKGFLTALGEPPKDMVGKLSQYQPVKLTRGPSTGSGSRPFKCYVRENAPYRTATMGEANALPPGGGLYIVMDNFSPVSLGKDIGVARLIKPTQTVWMNKTDFLASGIDKMPEWLSVEQAIAKAKADYKAKHKHKNLARAEAVYKWLKRHHDVIGDELDKLSKLAKFPKRGPLPKLLALVREFKDVTTEEHSNMRQLLDVKPDAELAKIDALLREAKAKHPLIFELCGNWRMRSDASDNLLNALF